MRGQGGGGGHKGLEKAVKLNKTELSYYTFILPTYPKVSITILIMGVMELSQEFLAGHRMKKVKNH